MSTIVSIFFILQLAQLMADLQKMPGGASLLKKQEAKQKTKEKGSVSSVIDFQKLRKANGWLCWDSPLNCA